MSCVFGRFALLALIFALKMEIDANRMYDQLRNTPSQRFCTQEILLTAATGNAPHS
jgi:hypothetical protein